MKSKKITPDVTWKEITEGGTIHDPGNAHEFLTGDWRTETPKWSSEKCIHCLQCWVICPDVSILVKDGKITGIDYDHCKGCGMCSKECPVHAIEME